MIENYSESLAAETGNEATNETKGSEIAQNDGNESKNIGSGDAIPGPKVTLKTLTVRRYLDETVVPILLTGMQELVKERFVFAIDCFLMLDRFVNSIFCFP